MTPVKFKGCNTVFAKDQPEYQALPAQRAGDMVVTCWALTWRERIEILVRGRLWISVLTFNRLLQPLLPEANRGTCRSRWLCGEEENRG